MEVLSSINSNVNSDHILLGSLTFYNIYMVEHLWYFSSGSHVHSLEGGKVAESSHIVLILQEEWIFSPISFRHGFFLLLSLNPYLLALFRQCLPSDFMDFTTIEF